MVLLVDIQGQGDAERQYRQTEVAPAPFKQDLDARHLEH